jgi:hypothetical protein
VEEEPYLLELVRYLHLNPLRAGLVPDFRALERYPWCGHAGLLGHQPPPWLGRAAVLAWFAPTERAAVRAYRTFLREGVPQGRRPELVGGGLIRSLGGWAAVQAVRQRGDRVVADARILGTDAFVERMLANGDTRQRTQQAQGQRLRAAQELIRHRCRRARVGLAELQLGSRRRRVAAVRAELAVRLIAEFGLSLADAARQLGVSTSGIAKAIARTETPIVN